MLLGSHIASAGFLYRVLQLISEESMVEVESHQFLGTQWCTCHVWRMRGPRARLLESVMGCRRVDCGESAVKIHGFQLMNCWGGSRRERRTLEIRCVQRLVHHLQWVNYNWILIQVIENLNLKIWTLVNYLVLFRNYWVSDVITVFLESEDGLRRWGGMLASFDLTSLFVSTFPKSNTLSVPQVAAWS